MAAREGIGLVFFEGVQRILNRFDEWGNLQVPCLEMAECKAWPDCRDEQVADVGEVETEQDAEENLFECAEPASGNEHPAEQERDEIIADIGELEQAGEQRVGKSLQPHRGVDAEDGMIDGDEAGIECRWMNGGDERSQAVENQENRDHRCDNRKMKPPLCRTHLCAICGSCQDRNRQRSVGCNKSGPRRVHRRGENRKAGEQDKKKKRQQIGGVQDWSHGD